MARHLTAGDFSWADALPEQDRRRFTADLLHVSRARGGQRASLEQTIHEWRATAALHADADLMRLLSRPIDRVVISGPTSVRT